MRRAFLWLLSHSGFTAERPHRHSAAIRPVGMISPSAPTILKSPRMISGPSGYGVTVVVADAGREDMIETCPLREIG